MPVTYENIGQTQTITSATNQITFSNISQDYTDLIVVGTYILSTTGNAVAFRVNGITSTSSYSFAWQSRGSASSFGGKNNTAGYGVTNWYTTPSSNLIGEQVHLEFMNYTGTHHFKNCLSRAASIAGNSIYQGNELVTNTINTTSPITSLSFSPDFTGSVTFGAGTTITLYGIKKA